MPSPSFHQLSPTTSGSPAKRPWAVWMISSLLLGQAVGQTFFSVLYLLPWLFSTFLPLNAIGWEVPVVGWRQTFTGVTLAGLGVWTLGTAFGFWALRPLAWLNAMLVQGVTLAAAIAIYFDSRAPQGYVMMVYALFVVLYLFQGDVQTAFRLKAAATQRAHRPLPPDAEANQ